MPALLNHYGLEYADSKGLVTLDGIVKSHPFVFRLQERASESFNANGDLIAPKFIPPSSEPPPASTIPPIGRADLSLASLLEHVAMWKIRKLARFWGDDSRHRVSRHNQRWISTTFSLPYILYEGKRRNAACHHDTEVLIVDMRLLCPKSFLASRALQKRRAKRGRHGKEPPYAEVYEDTLNFARVSQEVLIYGHIPSTALVARWPYEAFESSVYPLYYNHLTIREPVFRDTYRWSFRRFVENSAPQKRSCLIGGEDDLERSLQQFKECLKLQHVTSVAAEDSEAVAAVVSSVMYFMLPKGFAGSSSLLELYRKVCSMLRAMRHQEQTRLLIIAISNAFGSAVSIQPNT